MNQTNKRITQMTILKVQYWVRHVVINEITELKIDNFLNFLEHSCRSTMCQKKQTAHL